MKLLIYKLVLIFTIAIIAVEPAIIYAQDQSPSMAALSGEELFIQNRCVRCHTIGRGRFVGPDLSAVGERYSKDEIIKWIENPQQIYQQSGKMPYNEGYPPMPPMNVPPGQAKAIADYILSFNVKDNTATKGSIYGQVVNKTVDGPAPEVELTLTSYMGERPTDDKTIKSDEQGNFSFEDLDWNRSYGLTVNFKGTQYSTDKMVFNPDESTKVLTLPIYEPTFEENDLAVVEGHMIVQAAEGVLSVADLSLYSNNGDNVYVGGKETEDGRKESLKFSLPKSAQDLNLIHGVKQEDLVQTDYGFADTTSMLPGEKRIVYTYNIPLGSGTTKFDKTIDYPTDNFLLLISDTGKDTKVTGLTSAEAVEVQGENFLKWTGADLKPGHEIKIRFEGQLFKESYLKWGVLGFLLLVIVIGFIYSNFRKNKSALEPSGAGGRGENVDPRTALLQEIAQLDDNFESGQIDENTYRETREKKKEELKKIIRRL